MTVSASLAPRIDRWVRNGLLPLVQLVLWLFLYLSLLLGGWVFLGWSIGGWSPVVITTGSMESAMSPGDVLLIEKGDTASIAQRSIIVFDRDGEHVAHRVFEVEADGYVTKGDANNAPDAARVHGEDVIGAGRLLVPLVGMPVVWAQSGQWLAVGAWLVLSIAGLVHLAGLGLHLFRHRDEQSSRRTEMPVAQQGIRRVRGLVAILILAQYVLDASRFDVLEDSTSRIWLLLLSMTVLLGTNLVSRRLRSPVLQRIVPLVELGLDTALVVLLATLTGTSGIGWVLFALPIIEAAVRFRLIGALVHWMVLTVVTMAARIWTAHLTPAFSLLDELEMVLDQLSVLFLVVVPGAYLAEQLIGDVATQQRATGRALDRGQLLERVAEAGHEVTRLGGEHVEAIIEGTRQLGFDRVDVVLKSSMGSFQRVAGDEAPGLPPPGSPASGVDGLGPTDAGAFVDRSDPGSGEIEGLDAHGLDALLVHTVARKNGKHVVLRAGVDRGHPLTSAQVDAFRLLVGQASVALQNDQLLSELNTMHDELEHQAQHDALTQLPNRVLLLRSVRRALLEDGDRPALLFLDLNGFKPVNDRLGHDAGDDLLKLVARRLTNATPRDGQAARLGGDEFTILVPGRLTNDRAVEIAREVWMKIREPFEVSGERVNISTSIGIAFGEPGMDESELIRRADVAMYQAKQRRDDETICELYRPEFDQAEARRAQLVARIPQAIRTDEVRLDYQPVVHTGSALQIVGVEALVRWTHPELGEIPPGDIIEMARIAGVRDELNWWIINRATTDAAGWVASYPRRSFFVAVNASPEELASQKLLENVADALDRTGLDPKRLFVEISERLVSPDMPSVQENMRALREAGVGLLLDDFGEGQTSLSYLHELPVAGIKLDRKLVVNSLRSDTDRIVLESIVGLCHRLGLVLVAEGIETQAHLDMVTGVGCQMVQGYFLDRPRPAEYITSLLDRAFGGADRARLTPAEMGRN
ncbi:MAG: signal peptidase I [Actinomycetia bacterium]|nr:signal peptidase I [Actinomycetes bacterium]